MWRVLGWIVRWLCLLVVLCLALAVLRSAFDPMRHGDGWKRLFAASALWIALAGFISRVIVTRLRGSDPFEFLDTLEHELTHALTGYLTFAPPMSLTATLRDGGEVALPRRNPIAVLSPYFLPLYAGTISLLTLVLKPDFLSYGRYAVAFLLGSFVYRLLREFHPRQSDFGQYGFVFSLAFIAAMLPLSLTGILEASRLMHLPWRHEVWNLFLEQGHWLEKTLTGLFHKG